jgi:cytochrome c553
MKTKFLTLALITTFACGAMQASAASHPKRTPEEVVKLASTCVACHGEGGAKPIQADYPVLAGQNSSYLSAALLQYKTKKRTNAVMGGFAAALKAEDIKDLSEYFSKQPSPLMTKY